MLLNLNNPINYSPILDELEEFLEQETRYLLSKSYNNYNTQFTMKQELDIITNLDRFASEVGSVGLLSWILQQGIDIRNFSKSSIIFEQYDVFDFYVFYLGPQNIPWRPIITDALAHGWTYILCYIRDKYSVHFIENTSMEERLMYYTLLLNCENYFDDESEARNQNSESKTPELEHSESETDWVDEVYINYNDIGVKGYYSN